MNSTEVSNSWRSAATRSSTSASTVASSAVVGSSRISSDGEEASAIAITARCAIPPDSSCGYRRMTRPGSEIWTLRSMSSADAMAAPEDSPGDLEDLGDLPPHPQGRVQRPPGLLVHHRDGPGPQLAQGPLAHGQRVQPVDADRPAAHPAVARQVTHQRERGRGLARSGLAHQPVRFAASDGERDVAQGEAILAPHPVGDVHVRDDERRPGSRESRRRRRRLISGHALSTCSIESAIKATAVTSEAMASAGNSVCHQ